ncbi:MAG: DUF4437 domain-containing protein [Alphaproteobacteria bacterium]|nr:DUF4437 domain-containing protein [Alphaproteobacteria bacterium]
MARPHIEFIHAFAMHWQKGLYGGARDDVEHKMLSCDPDTGESSVLIRYPAGWSRATPEHLQADEEIYVLDGALVVNGRTYAASAYAHWPAGYARRSASSPGGAVVLTFFSGEPRARAGEAAPGLFDGRRLIEWQSLYEQGWDADYRGVNSPEIAASGSRKKLLRSDPVTHDQTWIMGILPSYREKKVESHPVVQECYIIAGELPGNYGFMVAGAYFWRPPEILHGPYGSKTGAIVLSRTKGGSLTVDYFDLDEPYSFDPPHRVVLPPSLRLYGQPQRLRQRY